MRPEGCFRGARTRGTLSSGTGPAGRAQGAVPTIGCPTTNAFTGPNFVRVIPMRPLILRPRSAVAALALTGALLLAGCTGSSPEPAPTNGGNNGNNPTPTSGGNPGGPGNGTGPGNHTTGGNATNITAGITVFAFNGQLTLSGGAPQVVYVNAGVLPGLDHPGAPFHVDEGASAIYVELVWSDKTMDLDMFLDSDLNGTSVAQSVGGTHGSGDPPAIIQFEDASKLASGDWQVRVFAKDAVNTQYKGAISVFYGGEPIPPGYTALTA